jgi:hypothetical protein
MRGVEWGVHIPFLCAFSHTVHGSPNFHGGAWRVQTDKMTTKLSGRSSGRPRVAQAARRWRSWNDTHAAAFQIDQRCVCGRPAALDPPITAGTDCAPPPSRPAVHIFRP